MKNHLPNSVAIIAITIVLMCFVQILDLKSLLVSSQNEMSMQISRVANSVDNIHFTIANSLNEQAKLLADSDWAFDQVDIDARMMTVRCAVTPKEYRPNATTVILVCNDVEYPMMLDKGEYAVVLSIPLFGESVVSKVQLIDGNTVRTEALDWWLTPHFEVLPQVNASFSGRGSGSVKDGKFNLKKEGEIEISIYQNENNGSVHSISLLDYIDGTEIERTNIPLNTDPSPSQYGAIPDRSVLIGHNDSQINRTFYYPLDKSVAIPFGSTYERYIEVVDNYGFRYRVMMEWTIVDNKGNPTDELHYWHGGEAAIYDEQGHELWVSGKGGY